MIFSTVYLSTAREPWTADQLTDLLSRSRSRNAAVGVTGLLVSRDDVFMQILEGEEQVVQHLYRKIAHDRRHRDVTNIWESYAPRRYFADWSMGFRSLIDQPIDLPGYRDLLIQPLDLRRASRRVLVEELLTLLGPSAAGGLADPFRPAV